MTDDDPHSTHFNLITPCPHPHPNLQKNFYVLNYEGYSSTSQVLYLFLDVTSLSLTNLMVTVYLHSR